LTTHELADQNPVVTPDGRYVVFMSDRTGPPHIWRMDIDGSNQTQLTHDGYNLRPQITPDGRTIFFESSLGKGWSLWKIPIEGGQPAPLNDKFVNYPAISPDGKLIAVNYAAEANKPTRLAIFSTETGEIFKVFDISFTDRETPLDWTPDGQAVVYRVTKKDIGNLWAQPIAGGSPKQITNFTSDRIFWYKYSRDGKQLAVSRGNINRDIVLITNFR
jgi:TolB protein